MTTPTAPGGGTKTHAAAALVRAHLVNDKQTGVFVIQQNGGAQVGPEGAELIRLLIDTAGLATLILLKASGYDTARALATIDAWMEQAANREQP
jgi:hypothetical protein